MQHSPYGLLESADRAYKVTCSLNDSQKLKTMTYELTVPITNSLGRSPDNNLKYPPVFMKVVTGVDPTITSVEGLIVGRDSLLVIYYRQNAVIDVSVTNCYAHDGAGYKKVQLIDEYGCPGYRDIVSLVQRRNIGVFTYVFTQFRAFKFPDRPNVYFKCQVEVCHHQCISGKCSGNSNRYSYTGSRHKRDLSAADFGTSRRATPDNSTVRPEDKDVVSPAAAHNNTLDMLSVFRGVRIQMEGEEEAEEVVGYRQPAEDMCVTRSTFAWGMALMGGVLTVATIISGLMCLRARQALLASAKTRPKREKAHGRKSSQNFPYPQPSSNRLPADPVTPSYHYSWH